MKALICTKYGAPGGLTPFKPMNRILAGKLETLRSIGADHVVNHTKESFNASAGAVVPPAEGGDSGETNNDMAGETSAKLS